MERYHDAVPHEEIWIKSGGDNGGTETFTLLFQMRKLAHPNSIQNTISLLVFAGDDLPCNLEATFNLFQGQIEKLQATTWHGKRSRVILFREYEFLSLSYGFSRDLLELTAACAA